jgi:hypothetical protein
MLKKYDEQRPIKQAVKPALQPIITAPAHFFVNIAAIAAGIIRNAYARRTPAIGTISTVIIP